MLGTYSSSKTALKAITLALASGPRSDSIKVKRRVSGVHRDGRTSTTSRARAPSNRPHLSPCALHSSTRTVRRARSRTRTLQWCHSFATTPASRTNLRPKCVYPLISRARFNVAPNFVIADQLRPGWFHATLLHAPISDQNVFTR